MEDSKTISSALSQVRKLYKMAGYAVFSEKVRGGYLSHNYILKNGDTRLFLKQYRFNSREKINEIHRAKFFFKNGGIPIILPIQNDKGDYIFEDSGKFYTLFPFVEGKIIQRTERSPRAFASAGKMLARIHILSRRECPNIISSYDSEWDKEVFLEKAETIKRKIETISNKSDFDRLALRTIECKIRLAKEDTLCYKDMCLKKDHLIHGDYHGQNIFYNDEDEITNVFDVEKTELSPRVLEIARSIDYMCFSNNYEIKNFDDARNFLSAYEAIYPFDMEELARGIKTYYLKKAHSIWIEEEHYMKENFRVDCFLEGELLMLQYYPENFDEFIKKIT